MIIDTHVHTIYSNHWLWGHDSLTKPRDLIKVAIKNGLDGLAVTDHNNVKGSLKAKEIAKGFKDFMIITGTEIRTLSGDMIALGVDQDIPSSLSVEETIEKIHDLGGIAVGVHPFGTYVFRKCLEEKAVKTDAIEVYNASLLKYANSQAELLAKKYKKPITAGSDAHGLREIGNGAIKFSGDPIEAILKKRVEIVTKKTTIFDIINMVARKYIGSIEWRLTGKRGDYY